MNQDLLDRKNEAVDLFRKKMSDVGFSNVPAEGLIQALAIVWSSQQ